MTGVVIAAIIAFIVVGVVLARNTSSRKKKAMESLDQERKSVGRYSIVDLVDAEVNDLQLRSIAGAKGLAPDVLLKVWSDTPEVHDCDRSDLRYEISGDLDPGDADVDDVTLVCTDGRPRDATPTLDVDDEVTPTDEGSSDSDA